MIEWSNFAREVKCEKCNPKVLANSNDSGFDRRAGPVDEVAGA